MYPKHLIVSLFTMTTLVACGQEQPSSPAPAPTPAPQVQPAPEQVPAMPSLAPEPASGQEASAPVAPDAALEHGRIKYSGVCAGCHGKNGEGQGIFPRVAGKPAMELAAKLKDYREGKILGDKTSLMAPNAKSLTDEDIDALANYMAGLKG